MNLFFTEKESSNKINDEDINDILNSLEEYNDDNNCGYYPNNYLFTEEYYAELTTKDLVKICQFYGLEKGTKGYKKSDYIHLLVAFESTPENYEYVEKRQRFWTYMIELKNDPIMKKYVIWD